MIAELLQRSDLCADGNLLPKNLDRPRSILDAETARARRLETDQRQQILGIRKPQHQVMQHTPSGNHAAGGNDDHRRSSIG